jgi:nucleoid-associated protein YgaU
VLIAAAAVLLVALLAVLFGTGVIDAGRIAGAGEDGAVAVASDGQADENETAAADERDGDAADSDAADGNGEQGREDGQAVIGDTTNVTPSVRQFIETLDLENPPEGLEAREGAGGIIITILDIIRLANRIAVDNGYRELGAPPSAGPNPDWIYPDNVFELPDGSTHTVVSGDTLWDITAEFIQEQLAGRYARYAALMEDYRSESTEIQALVEELTTLRNNTYSENFRNIVDQTIEEVGRTN